MSKINIKLGGSGNLLLTIVFFAAKIFHYIDWSWKWVLAPLWLPFLVLAAVALFAAIFAVIAAVLK
jgi:hypothetical protein